MPPDGTYEPQYAGPRRPVLNCSKVDASVVAVVLAAPVGLLPMGLDTNNASAAAMELTIVALAAPAATFSFAAINW